MIGTSQHHEAKRYLMNNLSDKRPVQDKTTAGIRGHMHKGI